VRNPEETIGASKSIAHAEEMRSRGWSEPAAINAPVEDEAVEPVLGMNQKHILPAQSYCFFFFASSLPQNFSLLPTYPLSYLPLPTSHH
jgi:hypothetical protein